MDVYFTKEHEWLKVEGTTAIVGITDYAQSNLGDVVFVELPDIDRQVMQSDAIAVVESAKSVSDVYAPLDGKIVELNDKVLDETTLINTSPQEEGWLFKIELSNDSQLEVMMSESEYNAYIQTL